MELKKEIQKIVENLKTYDFDRRKIEKELNYKEFYLDQAISKGGNSKLLNSLKLLLLNVEKSNKDGNRGTFQEPEATYLQKRNSLKLNGKQQEVPVYGGFTTLGNIEILDDENVKHKVVAQLPAVACIQRQAGHGSAGNT